MNITLMFLKLKHSKVVHRIYHLQLILPDISHQRKYPDISLENLPPNNCNIKQKSYRFKLNKKNLFSAFHHSIAQTVEMVNYRVSLQVLELQINETETTRSAIKIVAMEFLFRL